MAKNEEASRIKQLLQVKEVEMESLSGRYNDNQKIVDKFELKLSEKQSSLMQLKEELSDQKVHIICILLYL